MYPSQEKGQSQVLLVVEEEENFLSIEVGTVGLSRNTVHHGVTRSLNVHQDCSSLPADSTLETQLSRLRGLEVLTLCPPLKSRSFSYYSGQRPMLPNNI
jgi:hypothetical protein